MNKAKQQKFLFGFATIFFAVLVAVFISLTFIQVDETSRSFAQLMWISRLICALSAGIIVAALPGTLELDWADKPKIKATGAVAAFILVFYVNPPEIAATIANDLSEYDEALIRCENGLQHASGAREEAYSNCPLLLEIDPDRWEGHYHNGRLAWWDREYTEAIRLQATSLEQLRKESPSDTRNISRVLSGLNYARIDRAEPEDFQALANDIVAALRNQTPPVTLESRTNLLLQYASASILDQDLLDIEFWNENLNFLTNIAEEDRLWVDFYVSCISLILDPSDEQVQETAFISLSSSVTKLRKQISSTSSESMELMARLLTPGPQIYEGYRAGFPPRCPQFFEALPQKDLQLLVTSLG